jgi:hypothetical protein
MGFGFDRDLTVAGVSSLEIKNSKYGKTISVSIRSYYVTMPRLYN